MTQKIIAELEKELAEQLDNLLIEKGILPKRKLSFVTPGSSDRMVMVIVKEEAMRIKFEIFPNEVEEPHFKVTYQGVSCRFKIKDCTMMKAEAKNGMPVQIKKIKPYIEEIWKKNKRKFIKKWNKSRPTDNIQQYQIIQKKAKSR